MRAALDTWRKEYSQEADTCSSEEHQTISIEQEDGGGGPFWRISTQQWAIDSIEELVELLEAAGVSHRADVTDEGDPRTPEFGVGFSND